MVAEGGASGRGLGYEGTALMKWMSPLMREPPSPCNRALSPCPPPRPSPGTAPAGTLSLDLQPLEPSGTLPHEGSQAGRGGGDATGRWLELSVCSPASSSRRLQRQRSPACRILREPTALSAALTRNLQTSSVTGQSKYLQLCVYRVVGGGLSTVGTYPPQCGGCWWRGWVLVRAPWRVVD